MSTKIQYKDFSWRRDKCYLREEYVGKVVKDGRTEEMFRFVWPDGHVSEDYYNKTRSMDNLIKLDMRRRNTTLGPVCDEVL